MGEEQDDLTAGASDTIARFTQFQHGDGAIDGEVPGRSVGTETPGDRSPRESERTPTGDVRTRTDGERTPADDEPARQADELTPELVATRLCEGFQHHDAREREAAIEAFAAVDAFQFRHVDRSTARRAAEAYVDALWAKDAVEDRCRVDGDGGVVDPSGVADDSGIGECGVAGDRSGAAGDGSGVAGDGSGVTSGGDGGEGSPGAIDHAVLAAADWSDVEAALAERAALVGIDPEYAAITTEGWRRHKVGGDYWSAHLRAQQLELRAALQDPAYPEKPRHGQSGSGPEATRYLLGVELHDCRRWTEARVVMVPYFEAIERAVESGAETGDAEE